MIKHYVLQRQKSSELFDALMVADAVSVGISLDSWLLA
jgi:hypothetical protein